MKVVNHAHACGLPVDAAHSLAVVTRVPAGIQDNHAVGTNQVNAQAAGFCRNLKNRQIRFMRGSN